MHPPCVDTLAEQVFFYKCHQGSALFHALLCLSQTHKDKGTISHIRPILSRQSRNRIKFQVLNL